MNVESRRILLVDDVRVFLELECMFLQRKGFEILTAMTGREAIEKAHAHKPHVVLLDYVLPDMRGDDCCRQIKRDPDLGHVIVIMVTTAGGGEEHARCAAAGCDDYLTKPIKQVVFIDRIRKALDLKTRLIDRIAVSTPVRYRAGDGPEVRGVTLNLSTTGLYIVNQAPPEPGTKVSLSFALPGCPRPFKAAGEVVWNTRPAVKSVMTPGFGLRLLDLDHADSVALTRFVMERLAQEEDTR